MSDPTSTTPVWLTIVLSVVSSGIFSAIISTSVSARFERKKQNKQFLLERLERALSMIRKDCDEMSDLAVKCMRKGEPPRKVQVEIMTSDDLEIAILMCAPKLGGALKKYTETRVQLIGHMGLFPPKTDESARVDARRQISETAMKLKTYHDGLKDSLLASCRNIIGVRTSPRNGGGAHRPRKEKTKRKK